MKVKLNKEEPLSPHLMKSALEVKGLLAVLYDSVQIRHVPKSGEIESNLALVQRLKELLERQREFVK